MGVKSLSCFQLLHFIDFLLQSLHKVLKIRSQINILFKLETQQQQHFSSDKMRTISTLTTITEVSVMLSDKFRCERDDSNTFTAFTASAGGWIAAIGWDYVLDKLYPKCPVKNIKMWDEDEQEKNRQKNKQ